MSVSQGKVKVIFKGISGILKNALMVLIIQAVMSFFSLAMMADKPSALLIALSMLSGISFFAILFFVGKSSAYSDFQIYKNNLIRQKHGDSVSLDKTIKQYRWYYGYITALIPSLIFIIFAVIGIIQNPALDKTNTLGIISFFANLATVVPLMNAGIAASLYLVLAGEVLIVASYGTGYLLHGIKLKIQYEELQRGSSER